MALPRIREALDIKPLEFNGQFVLTKQMVADFYEVDVRTIERQLVANEEELFSNGYKVLTGNLLKEFKLQYQTDIDVGQKTKALGIFDFRSFLNIGMLLTSEKAKWLRSMMLDIVIAVINEKTGGGTKYINRRDRNCDICFSGRELPQEADGCYQGLCGWTQDLQVFHHHRHDIQSCVL